MREASRRWRARTTSSSGKANADNWIVAAKNRNAMWVEIHWDRVSHAKVRRRGSGFRRCIISRSSTGALRLQRRSTKTTTCASCDIGTFCLSQETAIATNFPSNLPNDIFSLTLLSIDVGNQQGALLKWIGEKFLIEAAEGLSSHWWSWHFCVKVLKTSIISTRRPRHRRFYAPPDYEIFYDAIPVSTTAPAVV